MARSLRLDIDGDAAGSVRALDEVELSVRALAAEARTMGNRFQQAARDSAELDVALAATRREAAALARQFNETRDPAIGEQLRQQRQAASELRRIRSDIIGDTERDARRATTAWSNAARDLENRRSGSLFADAAGGTTGLFSAIGNMIGGGGAGEGTLAAAPEGALQYGAAALPALAVPTLSAVGGAINAVGGLGAVGTGAVGAVMGDPEGFKKAWTDAAGQVKNALIQASIPFQGPLLDAIGKIGPMVASWHLDETLANAAKYVQPLAEGLMSFGTSVVHGLSALSDHAGPEINALRIGMIELGNAADVALQNIASGSEGGAAALGDLLGVLAASIEATGILIGLSEKLFGTIHDHPTESAIGSLGLTLPITLFEKLIEASTDAHGHIVDITKATDLYANVSLPTLDVQLADAASMLKRMNAEFDKAISAEVSLSQANVDVAQGFADLTNKFEKGAHALDITTQKGRDNISMINEQITKLQQQRDASIAAGDGSRAATDAANAAYASQLKHLEDVLVKLGLNRAAVEAFLGAFHDKTFTITQRVVTVHENVGSVSGQGVVSGGAPRAVLGGSAAYASGTSYTRAGWALVGEQGPEFVRFPAGAEVLNAAQSRRALSNFGHNGSPTPIAAGYNITVNAGIGVDGSVVGSQIVDLIRMFERSNGAGWRAA